jgi:hypothetical protein
MATTFISYRREDAAGYAGRLHESLESRLGDGQVFRDVDTIAPGQDFIDAIESRVRDCRVLLALIGNDWLAAATAVGGRRLDQPEDYVRLEIAAGLNRADVLVIPVLLEGARMPPADSLPESIRALARRQAVTLRDETWDSDVDRLAEAVDQACSASRSRHPSAADARTVPGVSSRVIGALGAIAVLVALAAWYFSRADAPAAGGSPGETDDGSHAAAAATSAYALTIPRISEIAHGTILYSVISASLTPLGKTSTLRVRLRVSNEGHYDTNFWDASFRLAAGGQVLAPTSGLNEILPGRSIVQGIVTFDVPRDADSATLRILSQDKVGELPLSLRPTGRPPEDEKADAGDSLSRAMMRTVTRDPVALLNADGLEAQLTRVVTRRFANVLRVFVDARITNTGRYPIATSAMTVRLITPAGGVAPSIEPNEAIEPASNTLASYSFDLPPATTTGTLKAAAGKSEGEHTLSFD